MSDVVLNIAHRGARSLAPENTMAAAKKAYEIGADLWETDVMATVDASLILMHDDSLERTTNAPHVFPNKSPWNVTEFSLDELRDLDAGTWFVKEDPFKQIAAGEISEKEQTEFGREKIPTIEEALIYTQEMNWRVNLELKMLTAPLNQFPIYEKVLETIKTLGIDKKRVIISSFEHEWLRIVKKREPQIEIQALVGTSVHDSLNLKTLEFATYNILHSIIEPSEVQVLRNRNIAVNLWTVNKKEQMVKFIRAGAAGIITDFPQYLKPLFHNQKH